MLDRIKILILLIIARLLAIKKRFEFNKTKIIILILNKIEIIVLIFNRVKILILLITARLLAIKKRSRFNKIKVMILIMILIVIKSAYL